MTAYVTVSKSRIRTNTIRKIPENHKVLGKLEENPYISNLTANLILSSRYNILIVGSNGFGTQSELAVDDLSLSPQCFGLAVDNTEVGPWRQNMSDHEFCKYYGRGDCAERRPFGE